MKSEDYGGEELCQREAKTKNLRDMKKVIGIRVDAFLGNTVWESKVTEQE